MIKHKFYVSSMSATILLKLSFWWTLKSNFFASHTRQHCLRLYFFEGQLFTCQLLAKMLTMHFDFEAYSFHHRLVCTSNSICTFTCFSKLFNPLFSFILID